MDWHQHEAQLSMSKAGTRQPINRTILLSMRSPGLCPEGVDNGIVCGTVLPGQPAAVGDDNLHRAFAVALHPQCVT